MTTPSRSWRAPVRPAEQENPLPRLIELLLDLLLHDVQDGRNAQLSVGRLGSTWLVGDAEAADGHLISTEVALADGTLLTLQVRADAIDDGPVQAQLQRFVRPLVACLALESRREQQSDQARDAVAAIERLAVTDLATGIVMARRDCDPQTARTLLADWSARTGIDLQTRSAVEILELFTAARTG